MMLLVSVVLAADISGKWSGDMPGRGGDMTATTFTFKADGEKLTGSMTGPQGEIRGNSIKILYKGAVSGNEIKMTREREGSGQPREFTIKRSGT
jgi:hypothetical protein